MNDIVEAPFRRLNEEWEIRGTNCWGAMSAPYVEVELRNKAGELRKIDNRNDAFLSVTIEVAAITGCSVDNEQLDLAIEDACACY